MTMFDAVTYFGRSKELALLSINVSDVVVNCHFLLRLRSSLTLIMVSDVLRLSVAFASFSGSRLPIF